MEQKPQNPSRRAPSLFVEDGEGRTAVIAADEPAPSDPQEALRAREKRRRQKDVERLRQEADTAASVRRIRNTVLVIVTLGAIAWGGWWMNQKWEGRWPVFLTWSVMAFVMLAGLGWALWYTEKA